jgi:hypothetical protein
MGFLIFCWLVVGVLCAVVAIGKGRSGFGWFFLGCIFGPLALLCAAVMSRESRQDERGLKTCPHCAEKVQLQATLCKHCHQPLEGGHPSVVKIKSTAADDWANS